MAAAGQKEPERHLVGGGELGGVVEGVDGGRVRQVVLQVGERALRAARHQVSGPGWGWAHAIRVSGRAQPVDGPR